MTSTSRCSPRRRCRVPVSCCIAITERDIQHQGRWPIPDATLAQVLQILTQYAPRAIGIDIYRDVEVPPGRAELDAVLTANTHIIASMKSSGGLSYGVPPPPVLKDTEQFGCNDILVDPGGIVRRGLLFVADGETTCYSFALRLALLYLQAEGIEPQPDPTHPEYLRLQHTTIRPFAANDGSYVEADAQGYQFLLDFRDGLAAFPNFSLTALLAGEVDPEAIRDKVVLIGVKAESVKDWFYTPHNRGRRVGQEMSGTDLHAHMIGQLLRFALDHSPPVSTASEGQEVLWLLLWSVMGGVIGLWVRGPWRLALWIAGGLLALHFVTYSAFEGGWWIPVVPPALAWSISAVVVTAYMTNQEKRQRTLLMQLFARHVSPEVAETIWQQREQLLHHGRHPLATHDCQCVVQRCGGLYHGVGKDGAAGAHGLVGRVYRRHDAARHALPRCDTALHWRCHPGGVRGAVCAHHGSGDPRRCGACRAVCPGHGAGTHRAQPAAGGRASCP